MLNMSRSKEIQRVLIITMAANLLVATAKLVVGLLTGSLAMISDGANSALDSTSNVIGLIGNALAARPPDHDHPYGHRRFETLASMMVSILLILTAWEIVKSSISRLTEGGTPQVGLMNFISMLVTLVVNVGVTAYEHREGKRLGSEFLLADAEYTRSSILVSITVVASLIAVRLGWVWMDAAAALVVVVLIMLAAWRIVKNAVGILVDRAALEAEAVGQIVETVAGVQKVSRVRSRGSSDDIHLDLDVHVAAPTTAEHSASIAQEIRSRLRERYGSLTDIQVNFLPIRDRPPDYALMARAEADALGLSIHEVTAAAIEDGLALSMHVEVDPEQSVCSAHQIVSEFEKRLYQAIPNLKRVDTHIEPAHTCKDARLDRDDAYALGQSALRLAQRLYPDNHWHALDIRGDTNGGYALSLHCRVAGDMSIHEAHSMAEMAETQIRAALPVLQRVTIHTEPLE
jgi:cation diffusion facilitator family transporter